MLNDLIAKVTKKILIKLRIITTLFNILFSTFLKDLSYFRCFPIKRRKGMVSIKDTRGLASSDNPSGEVFK